MAHAREAGRWGKDECEAMIVNEVIGGCSVRLCRGYHPRHVSGFIVKGVL